VKKFTKSTPIIIALLLFAALASALDYGPAYVYWVEPGTKKVFAWAPVPGAEVYEIYLFRMENARSYLVGRRVAAPTHSITFNTPGTYVLYARAGMTVDGVLTWGEWRNSLDPACGVVNGLPQPWTVYVPMR
jgi:hypothetical protein